MILCFVFIVNRNRNLWIVKCPTFLSNRQMPYLCGQTVDVKCLGFGRGGGWLTDTHREARIAESLFILFASLTYAYYSTIASFYHIWSRERAKYETVIHCSVPV